MTSGDVTVPNLLGLSSDIHQAIMFFLSQREIIRWSSTCKDSIRLIGSNIATLSVEFAPKDREKQPRNNVVFGLQRWATDKRLQKVKKLDISTFWLPFHEPYDFLAHLRQIRDLKLIVSRRSGRDIGFDSETLRSAMKNIIHTPSLVTLERLEMSFETSVDIDVQGWIPMAAHLRCLKELKIVSTVILPSSKDGARWTPFFALLPPTLENLEVDVSLDDVGDLRHLSKLSRLRVGAPADWLSDTLFAPRAFKFGERPNMPELRRLPFWSHCVERLATVLPRFLPVTATFHYVERDPNFGDFPVVDSLLSACERATTDVPLECLKFLWEYASQHGCDPKILAIPLERNPAFFKVPDLSILDRALSANPDHAQYLLSDALAFDVDVLQNKSRLPLILNLKRSHPDFVEWAVGALSAALRRRNLPRRALESFFSTNPMSSCSIAFAAELGDDAFLDILSDSRLRGSLAIDVNARLSDGSSLLHHAADLRSSDAVKVLLELGADPFVKDCNSRLPLDIVRSKDIYHRDDLAKADEIRNAQICRGVHKEPMWVHFRFCTSEVFREAFLLLGHTDAVTTIDFKKGTLVSGSKDGYIFVWHCGAYNADSFSSESAYRYVLPQGREVKQVIMSKDATFFLSLLVGDNKISVWGTPADSTRFPVFPTKTLMHTITIATIALSIDEKTIISGDASGKIQLWDLASGSCVDTIDDSENGAIVALCNSISDANTKLFVSAGEKGFVKLWNYEEGRLVKCYDPCRLSHDEVDHAISLCLPPDDSILGIGTRGSTLRAEFLNPEPGAPSGFQVNWELGPINSTNYSPNRYWLLLGTSQCLRVLDLELRTFVFRSEFDWDLNARTKTCGCLCTVWSEDGEYAFSGWEDGIIRGSRV
eukprot:TRINITY_DN5324_c0_g1_i1.p1 TRINITY_DN5324_c0_g1~~TRINITY_DN5324_c0_g1_i1.p1  ORF type:complete len:881 (+),score=74.00 TRINITY_DN5324_c0_g1_i1:35-2677(+)